MKAAGVPDLVFLVDVWRLLKGYASMKRIVSSLLMLCLLLFSVKAAADMAGMPLATSRSGIDFIAQLEGFRNTVYESGNGYYIGYGTACSPEDYPDGIDPETARELLGRELASIESKLGALASVYGFTLTQAQFDALVSFSYNLGTGWMNSSCRLRRHLIEGVESFTELEIMNSLGVWCHVSGKVNEALAARRIAEGKLFLFGDYTGSGGSDFNYLLFNAGGGGMEDDILFFRSGAVIKDLPEATRSGYSFSGWHTSSGRRLGSEEIITQNIAVTAHWTQGAPPIDIGTWLNPYKDVLQTDWFYTYVAHLSESKVVNGYPDCTFRPKNSVTNGEALKLILLASGHEQQQPSSSDWASGYLDYVVENGYFCTGDLGELSSPISRLTVANLAAEALGLVGSGVVSPFADTSHKDVLALYEAGIVEGSYDAQGVLSYNPGSSITRSEVSAIVWRISEYINRQAEVPPGEQDDASSGLPYGVDPIPGVPLCSYNPEGFFSQGGIKYYSADGLVAKVGVDVSEHQDLIDWQRVAAAGVEFAMIRVGYRGYTDGGLYEDKMFTQNIQGALSVGIKVGVYFFSQAVNASEAQQEAQFVLQRIAPYNITYPVVFDWENISDSAARTDAITTQRLGQSANAFCSAIEAGGYRAMIYFNTYIGLALYNLADIMSYDFWYAGYTSVPKFYYDFAMWQYWSSGQIDGIPGKVDMNLCFKDYG